MQGEYEDALAALQHSGWAVEAQSPPLPLPATVKARYRWIPTELEQFVTETRLIVSPGARAWILGISDFAGSSSAAFSWDEWERQSLDAATGDAELTAAVKGFWDSHFPLATSVKSGYAYFALQQSHGHIVCGEEPEFEETVVVASSFLDLLKRFAAPDAKFSRWV